ncbi:MAG TPA: type II 3-dehydroquinate dehydratase [Clostridia bacterium]|jgi:3-dehydroquinate dehydratase-2|nr:type II 3-dehydroquinate dehydratase [Clostridia bacterium]
MKILVINGPNLNMLGIREKELYGAKTYADLEEYVKLEAKKLNLNAELYQSNYEGDIVTAIQKAYKVYDGIVINAGAYTHTSIAILDALKAVNIPTVEVHLTDIAKREEFRRVSYVSLYAQKTICGKGFEGYKEALEFLKGE